MAASIAPNTPPPAISPTARSTSPASLPIRAPPARPRGPGRRRSRSPRSARRREAPDLRPSGLPGRPRRPPTGQQPPLLGEHLPFGVGVEVVVAEQGQDAVG